MSNNREVEFDGDLWFYTYGSSHKVDEVGRVPKVNASFADVDAQQ
jgi:general stress protein 26